MSMLNKKTKANAFIDDLLKVYKKHNLSLAHEDDQGGFLIQKYSIRNIEWIKQATDEIENNDN